MTNTKTLSKKRFWIIGTLVALIALCIHFYIVTTPEPHSGPMIQLARIDFKQPVDSLEASNIVTFVRHLGNIDNAYFNVPDGVLVYGYDMNSSQTKDNVYNKVIALKNYKAEKYVVDPKLLNSGCPIMNPNTFSYRFYIYYIKVKSYFS